MRQKIPESIINEIRSRNDIYEVISEFVLLKKAGKYYKGLCPFHSEKTPSFTVSPDKQIYHCFGCGAGGNVFKFLMEFEDLPFLETVRKLAARAHISLPEPDRDDSRPPTERDRLLKLNQLAGQYFTQLLNDPEAGQVAREYLRSRGFEGDILQQYQIGWASPAWRDLLTHLERRAKSPRQLLEKAGLVKRKEGSSKDDYYDRFRGRIMFPLKDPHGNLVGFAGRVLDDGDPKYLNSPETLLYKKGNTLFGFDRARHAIRNADCALIVEGYFDQIRAHQHGIRNVVATCGTALTENQISLLKNHTRCVVMVFDADPAGQAAAERSFELFLDHGMEVKILVLPEGHDPDSFILEHGGEKFLQLAENSQSFIESYINNAVTLENTETPDGRLRIVNRVLPLLARIQNSLERSEWAKYLSEQAGVDDSALLEQMKRNLSQNRPAVTAPENETRSKPDPELYLVHLLLSDSEVAKTIRTLIPTEEIQDPCLLQIIELVFRKIDEETETRIDRLVDEIEDPSTKTILTRIGIDPMVFDDPEKTAADCIGQIRKQTVEKKIQELKKQRNEAVMAGESERSREIEGRLQEIRLSLTPGGCPS